MIYLVDYSKIMSCCDGAGATGFFVKIRMMATLCVFSNQMSVVIAALFGFFGCGAIGFSI